MIATKMNDLSKPHRNEVNAYFLNDASASKWDNTGRAQDPHGFYPMACIHRAEWLRWKQTGIPAGLLWATSDDIAKMEVWFSTYGDAPYNFPVGLRRGGDPTNIQIIDLEGFGKFKYRKLQEEMVGAVKGNKAALSGAGSGLTPSAPKHAPTCPRHGERLRYDASSGWFVCGEADCDVRAKPKDNRDRFKDSVLKGDFELVYVGEDKYLVRHLATGAIIDFGTQLQQSGTGELHGQDGQWVIMVQFTGRREVGSEYAGEDA